MIAYNVLTTVVSVLNSGAGSVKLPVLASVFRDFMMPALPIWNMEALLMLVIFMLWIWMLWVTWKSTRIPPQRLNWIGWSRLSLL